MADRARRMPALFVGHGSPMNAIEDNEFRRGWADVARGLPRPEVVLCISAHWETAGVVVTAAERPRTIHDFYGFPGELFAVRFPARGSPSLARQVTEMVGRAGVGGTRVGFDERRGLDHGCWSVLRAMYPEADVPVVQLSLDTTQPASFHYALAGELAPLRQEGVLVLGSGDIVHNLRTVDFHRADGYDWAVRFNDEVRKRVLAGDHDALVWYQVLGRDAPLAVPTPEHYLPLLYILGLQGEDEDVALFNDRVVMGSISMTSLIVSRADDRGASQIP